jgi:hypothetical protein
MKGVKFPQGYEGKERKYEMTIFSGGLKIPRLPWYLPLTEHIELQTDNNIGEKR